MIRPPKTRPDLPDLPELSPLTVEDLAGAAVPGLPATGRGHSLIDASAPGRYVTQLNAEGFQAGQATHG